MTGRGTCTPMRQVSAGRRGPSRTERQPVKQAQGEKKGAGTPRQTRDSSKQQKYQHRDRAVTSALATPGCQIQVTLDWLPCWPPHRLSTLAGLSDSWLAHVIHQIDYRKQIPWVGSGSLRSQATRPPGEPQMGLGPLPIPTLLPQSAPLMNWDLIHKTTAGHGLDCLAPAGWVKGGLLEPCPETPGGLPGWPALQGWGAGAAH